MKTTKLVGALVAVAILGLSLGDALTGHGIKGNKNLNPIVVGDGTGGTGSTTTGGGDTTGGNTTGDTTTTTGNGNDNWISGECKTETDSYLIGYDVWNPNLNAYVFKAIGSKTVKSCYNTSGGFECEEGTVTTLLNGGTEGSFTLRKCAG